MAFLSVNNYNRYCNRDIKQSTNGERSLSNFRATIDRFGLPRVSPGRVCDPGVVVGGTGGTVEDPK